MSVRIIPSFNAGEITPRLAGRVDLEQYLAGLETCLNAIPQSHGSLIRRPGFEYVATAGDTSAAVRLIPFEFSVTQAYIIEAGAYYMRFYKDGGQIQSGGSAVEIATPYRAADLFELQFVQSADTLYIVHGNYSPRKLTRTSHTAWTLSVISYTGAPSDWGKESKAITGITNANPGVVTSASHGLSNGDTVLITNVAGMTEVNGIKYTVAGVAANTFELSGVNTTDYGTYTSGGVWNETDQPQTITFHEERVGIGGVPSAPQTIYLSKTGDFEDFTQGVADADGFQYTIASDQVNAIRWIRSLRKLIVGTAGGEWTVSGAGLEQPITPTSINVVRSTTHGSQYILPEVINNAILFVQRPGRILRGFGFEFKADAYNAADLTVFAEHLTAQHKLVQIAFQKVPDPILWCIRDDGTLISMTYNPEQQVVGWARHTTGTTGAPGAFKSVAVIPGTNESEVWVVVQRTINGTETRYIERMTEQIRENLDVPSAPTFSPDGGTGLTAPQSVTISSGIVQGDIFYTVNGSSPTAASALYAGAIEVGDEGTIVRAVVRDNDQSIFSPVGSSQAFNFSHGTVQDSLGVTITDSSATNIQVIGN